MVIAMSANFSFQARRERGAVLFVALVFLVLITLLALTAASTSVLQERMTGGLRNNQLALMGAESGLRGVEWSIWNRSNKGSGSNKFDCQPDGGSTNDSCYRVGGPNATVTAFRNAKSWLDPAADGGQAYATKTLTSMSNAQSSAQLANQPRYLIEDLGRVLPPNSPPSGQGGGRFAINTKGAGNQTLESFRITARSTGGNEGSVRAAESYFVALPPSN